MSRPNPAGVLSDEFGRSVPALAARLHACAARFSDLLAQLGDCPEADQARAARRGRDAMDVGLLDHGGQRLLRQAEARCR
jgi:dihydroxyacetone kinase